MQPALFRLGAITASSEFLTTVPRAAMVQAIKKHATEPRPIRDGQPILSNYLHANIEFYMLTDAERRRTAIRLYAEGFES
jgi:hypothetical protein